MAPSHLALNYFSFLGYYKEGRRAGPCQHPSSSLPSLSTCLVGPVARRLHADWRVCLGWGRYQYKLIRILGRRLDGQK